MINIIFMAERRVSLTGKSIWYCDQETLEVTAAAGFRTSPCQKVILIKGDKFHQLFKCLYWLSNSKAGKKKNNNNNIIELFFIIEFSTSDNAILVFRLVHCMSVNSDYTHVYMEINAANGAHIDIKSVLWEAKLRR